MASTSTSNSDNITPSTIPTTAFPLSPTTPSPPQHPSSLPTQPTPAQASTYLQSLLDRLLLLSLKDHRRLLGRLYVIDNLGNLVLSEAEEFPAPPAHHLNPALLEGMTLEEQDRVEEGWERWERYKPRSEPFGGPGTGWGGRGLGLVLVKLGDCMKVELVDENLEGGGDLAVEMQMMSG